MRRKALIYIVFIFIQQALLNNWHLLPNSFQELMLINDISQVKLLPSPLSRVDTGGFAFASPKGKLNANKLNLLLIFSFLEITLLFPTDIRLNPSYHVSEDQYFCIKVGG